MPVGRGFTRRRTILGLVFFVVLWAGCAQAPQSTTDGSAPPTASSAAPIEDNATLDPASAPTWIPGQWWRWEVRPRDHSAYNVTSVVGAETATTYLVGSAERDHGLRSTSFHVPPLGSLQKDDLAWTEHGHAVRILDFPLEDGKTWRGELEGTNLAFQAKRVANEDETLFEVNSTFVESDGQGPRGIYSPRLGQFVEYHHHYGSATPFASIYLRDHGLGHTSPIHILTPRDVFMGEATAPPHPPTPPQSFEARPEKGFLVFACFMAAGLGTFSATFLPPNQEESIDCQITNSNGASMRRVEVQHRSSIPGSWRVAYTAAGTGWIAVEVLGVDHVECVPGPASRQPC